MKYLDAFRFLAERRSDQLVITSAGNSGQAWWAVSRDIDRTFYLDASMSLSTMFASGLACALPQKRIWAFMGDGAFCMNPGMLMVERDLDLPNVVHFLVSNRAYGATSNAPLPSGRVNDYAAMARASGLKRVFRCASLEDLARQFDDIASARPAGHTFVQLEVEPFTAAEQKLEQPPFDGPELKYRFARQVERESGADVIGYRI